MAQKKEKQEKLELVALPCICGRDAVTVKTRKGKMISCPDPLNCVANPRTMWKKSEDAAIAEWNSLIYSLEFNSREKRSENA